MDFAACSAGVIRPCRSVGMRRGDLADVRRLLVRHWLGMMLVSMRLCMWVLDGAGAVVFTGR